VKASEKVHIENFVKYFREKYRLCWKEIYLKFRALFLRPERCRNCTKWFQMSHLAECPARIDPQLDTQDNFENIRFHEIDWEEKFEPLTNYLEKGEYEIFKTEIQVIDNVKTYAHLDMKDQAAVDLRLLKLDSN